MKKLVVKPQIKKYCIGMILLICVFSLLAFLNSSSSLKDVKEYYRVGMMADDSYEEIIENWEYVVKSKANKDIEVEFIYYLSGDELLKEMESGYLDIAFSDVLPLSKREISDSLEIIASSNVIESGDEIQNYYRALLLRRVYASDDELIQNEVDYGNATYCVMNSTSIAGYLGVMSFFEEQGIHFYDLNSIQIASYSEGIEYLANGTCEIAVGYTDILNDYQEMWEILEGSEGDINEELRIIYTSPKIFEDAVIISSELHDRLQGYLLNVLKENNYSESNNSDFVFLRNTIMKYIGGRN